MKQITRMAQGAAVHGGLWIWGRTASDKQRITDIAFVMAFAVWGNNLE
ncbi:hypothetical protein DESME_02115 [Desulfitobacterium metallireducens DSM 15288]|uniref:Uncharacterized protein n=1 Tax=Desulfitobacterium metallireducens DSM 15288 TaxID=871968 RepID=W0EGS8_9FIRM|nr:hypothetical protein DESME_02115 [Desulfitobacterium metallireducens DSM 15288]